MSSENGVAKAADFKVAAKQDPYQFHDYYNIDDLLTDEHKLIRDTARAWVKKEVSPIIEDAAQQALFLALLLRCRVL